MEVVDTAGQEEFMLFRDSSLSRGDAFLVLFAINSASSWYSLHELRNKIVRENDGDESIPMVIVANKRVSGWSTRNVDSMATGKRICMLIKLAQLQINEYALLCMMLNFMLNIAMEGGGGGLKYGLQNIGGLVNTVCAHKCINVGTGEGGSFSCDQLSDLMGDQDASVL